MKFSTSSCPPELSKPTRPFKEELIELSIVFVSTSTGSTDYTFHRYVKPTEFPTLTKLSTESTGVTQEHVDKTQKNINSP